MEPRAQNPISEAFAALARSTPGAPLVVSTARTATVGDVAAGAEIAARLVEPHVSSTAGAAERWPAGAAVGLAAGNGPGLLAALVALWELGLSALLLDPQAPEAEGRRIARSLGAAGLLRCRTPWPAEAADWVLADLAGTDEEAAAAALPRLPNCAVVKLTSGSTGAPRGVVTPAAALVADDAALTASMGLTPADRLLAFIPLSHSYGLSSLVLPALLRGTVLVVPEEGSLLEPFSAAERAGATVFPTVPAYVQALLRLSHPPAWPRAVRRVIAAGAPLEPAAARGFRETFGLPVHVFYGASECGGICYDREGGAGERGTVGTPVEGVRVSLAPPAGACRNDDGPGIVTVESASVASGYLPEPDPRLAGGRFTARDLAIFQGGELALRGRLDDLINVKGKKVDPREVEGVVGALAGVDEVVVLGVPASESGAEIVRAVIACRPGHLRAEQVLAYCREHLAAHKVPRSVILVPEMPRTARGKIDRPALLALVPAPVRSYGC